MERLSLSIVLPVYRNEGSIPELVERLASLTAQWEGPLEAVFVVDGSPDESEATLLRELESARLPAVVLALSRNFGSFAAIRAGMSNASGELVAVMAADLQEPPELVLELARRIRDESFDVVVGTRAGREDGVSADAASRIFWGIYRRFVLPDMPPGGVDVFACTRRFRDELLALEESRSTLVGLLFWLGFRRGEVAYHRLVRRHGKSAWSLRRKMRYTLDSIFAFSDLPLRLLEGVGLLGIATALALATVVIYGRMSGQVQVPGYAATAVLVLFFGGLNALGIGLVGEYVARAFENTKRRPGWVVARRRELGPQIADEARK